MKICIVCGTITNMTESSCVYCKNEDLRTVTRMKISLGKFDRDFELSNEEDDVLGRLRGYDILDEKGNEMHNIK